MQLPITFKANFGPFIRDTKRNMNALDARDPTARSVLGFCESDNVGIKISRRSKHEIVIITPYRLH